MVTVNGCGFICMHIYVILVEILNVTHAIKTKTYHMVNAFQLYTGMYTFSKINMNLIQQGWYRWPFFGVWLMDYHQLWQFGTRHTNMQSIRVLLIYFIADPVFWI